MESRPIITAICVLKAAFEKYAKKDGDSKTLTKAEFSELLKGEFLLDDKSHKAEVDSFFENLDSDGDGVISCEEFLPLLMTFCALL